MLFFGSDGVTYFSTPSLIRSSRHDERLIIVPLPFVSPPSFVFRLALFRRACSVVRVPSHVSLSAVFRHAYSVVGIPSCVSPSAMFCRSCSVIHVSVRRSCRVSPGVTLLSESYLKKLDRCLTLRSSCR